MSGATGWAEDVRWPRAELTPVARLRTLAAALAGVSVGERILDARFEQTWAVISDLEAAVPRFEPNVTALRILHREGRHLDVSVSLGRHLPRIRMDVVLEEGWCWMVARPRLHVVGMAAEPAGDRTRFALLEGTTLPVPRLLTRPVAPLLRLARLRHRRHLTRDLAGIAELLEQR